MPRMIGVRPLGVGRSWSSDLLWSGSVIAHGSPSTGWVIFSLGVPLLLMAIRHLEPFPRRSDLPPPAFVLTGFGVVLGAGRFGSARLVGGLPAGVAVDLPAGDGWPPHEGFLLGTAGGVGAFFFPRLWGAKTRQMFPEMVRPDPAWSRQARMAFWAGFGLIAGCVIDALGWVPVGSMVRLTAFGFFVVSEVAASLGLRSESTLGSLMRLGLFVIPVGLLLEAVVLPGRSPACATS